MRIEDTGERDLPAMLFLHGWPDTAALWNEQVAHFRGRYRCLRVTLPEYDDRRDGERGADFPVLVERIVAAAKARLEPRQRVTLVGHDWGAALSYRIERTHPEFVDRLITFDVGAHVAPKSPGHVAFLVSYQWWLATAWLIGKALPPIGNAMTRAFSVYARAPRGRFVHARSNYPYFYFWRAMLLKKYRTSLLRGYRPQSPILYLYGERKRYMFHSQRWLDLVDATAGSKAIGVPECGHWLMLNNPGLIHDLIDEWLGRPDVRHAARTRFEENVAGESIGEAACAQHRTPAPAMRPG